MKELVGVDQKPNTAARLRGQSPLRRLRKKESPVAESLARFAPRSQRKFQSLTLEFLGKYTLDLDYHKEVKLIFIMEFQAAFKDFTNVG